MHQPEIADLGSSVAEWVRDRFWGAVTGLDGTDIAALATVRVDAIEELKWASRHELRQLRQRADDLAARRRHRMRLRPQQAKHLLDALSHIGSEGRRFFLAAWALDRAFQGKVSDEYKWPDGITAAPVTFFETCCNAPPELGQMTALSACRRWFRTFWYAGRAEDMRAFGKPPKLHHISIPEVARDTLEAAAESRSFSVALVDLNLRGPVAVCSDKRIHVSRFKKDVDWDRLEGLLGQLRTKEVHVAVLPELSLSRDDLLTFCSMLRKGKSPFPALTAAGLTHRRAASKKSYVNEAVLLDSGGNEIFRHLKLEPFRDPNGSMEDIIPREEDLYHYADTPIGRLVINVCKDVRSDVPMMLNRVLGATIILVPAFSRRLDFATQEAYVLGARQRTVLAAANQRRPTHRDRCAWYAPIRGEEAGIRKHCQEDACPMRATVVTFAVAQRYGIIRSIEELEARKPSSSGLP